MPRKEEVTPKINPTKKHTTKLDKDKVFILSLYIDTQIVPISSPITFFVIVEIYNITHQNTSFLLYFRFKIISGKQKYTIK